MNSGVDDPPGVQNFSGIPSFIPPASSSSCRSVVPIGASYCPGRVTCPDSEKIFVPGDRSVPTLRYQSDPPVTIDGTDAMVSMLLTTVGDAYSPATAGNGGLRRGWPRRPSSESSSAVSSPQMYAPAPACTTMSRSKPLSRMFLPR